jgi:SAM-dependent methyltransferase
VDATAALAVLGEEGWRLLLSAGSAIADLPDRGLRHPLRAAEALRKLAPEAPPERRAAALELVIEGARLARKLGLDEGLLAVRGAVEQASSGRVATWHAQRLPEDARVLDMGCGCGGDAIALSHRVRNLIGVDADPVRAACAQMSLMALGLANARAVPGDAFDLLEGEGARATALFADPDRRPRGRRSRDPAQWEPSLPRIAALAGRGRALYVKAAPSLESADWTAQFDVTYVSHGGECVETFLEAPSEGRPEGRVSAVQLPDDGPSIALEGDRSLAPAGPVGEALYVADPAAIRGRLLSELCRRHGLHLVDENIAWLTGPAGVESPWLTGHEVVEVLRLQHKQVGASLRRHKASRLRAHTRGVAISAPELERRLSRAVDRAHPPRPIDLFACRIGQRPTAILASRLPTA